MLPCPARATPVLLGGGFVTPPLKEVVPLRPGPDLVGSMLTVASVARTASRLRIQIGLSSPSVLAMRSRCPRRQMKKALRDSTGISE